MHYQDGSNYYMLITNSGDQYGSYNSLRPFYVNLSSGNVTMSHNVTVGGTVNAASVQVQQSKCSSIRRYYGV